MIRSALVAVAVAALLAGCGGSGTGRGTATLWLTRDEGKTVLLVRSVPADESVLQALERSTKITTRYGGRFVQSVNGLSGSIVARHDWFFFVNGVEGDRGATDYRLHAGDIAWWDYRDWGRSGMSVPAVVGAFPEPFLHGFQWAKPGATIKGGGALATLLGHVVGPGPNEIDIESSVPPDAARAERDGNKVRLVLGVRIAEKLSSDPTALAYRYQVAK